MNDITAPYAARLTTLLALCAAERAREAEQQREAQATDRVDAVKYAAAAAVRTFGEEAAATFGEWLPLDVMDTDTLQAFAAFGPVMHLRYSAHCDGDTWFDLVSHCPTCGRWQEQRVDHLLALAQALQEAGAR